ncbi:hypothetical protein GOP47_0028360 [Adiantum capillus-veneris]|nr:hypothetical protein GOP47_0028360 [Adiantum capillus-veneris]
MTVSPVAAPPKRLSSREWRLRPSEATPERHMRYFFGSYNIYSGPLAALLHRRRHHQCYLYNVTWSSEADEVIREGLEAESLEARGTDRYIIAPGLPDCGQEGGAG